jgi:hypothetical protein
LTAVFGVDEQIVDVCERRGSHGRFLESVGAQDGHQTDDSAIDFCEERLSREFPNSVEDLLKVRVGHFLAFRKTWVERAFELLKLDGALAEGRQVAL